MCNQMKHSPLHTLFLSFLLTPMLVMACIAVGAERNGDGGVADFYKWDMQIPTKPGRLLRQEPLPTNLMLANAAKGVRILYTSTDGIGGKAPVAVSGAIYVPMGSAPPRGWPIIAWAHGTVGIADVCAPSWTRHSQRDSDYLNAWLSQGYAIVATDYQGLGTPGPHPYHVTKAEAWSVLDGIRAALKTFPELANTIVIVGQSQGAHAGLSASLLAKDYAPTLNILGTVATGVSIYAPFNPPTEAPQIAVPDRTGGGFNALLPLFNLYTYAALDPAFDPLPYVSNAAKSVFDALPKLCESDLEKVANSNNVTAENALEKKPEGAIAHASAYERYPTPMFREPVFIGSGLADTIALVEGQYNFIMAACRSGSIVESHYYPGKDHGGTVNASLVDSIPFVRTLFAGKSIVGNCRSVKPPVPQRNTTFPERSNP